MKKVRIYSTLSCPQLYQNWKEGGADLPVPDGEAVRIEGGANVASKNLVTPKGVVTTITEEQLGYLMANRHFLQHVENGFIAVDDGAQKDADQVAAEQLKEKDSSAPLTEKDFAKDGKKPSTGKGADK